jgi:membrane-associated phospholipid phosphatase
VSRPSNKLLRALGAAAAGFAALAGIVASGAATRLDQWACDNTMPLAGKPSGPPALLESVVPLLHASWHPLGVAVMEVVTLPGQVAISFLIVLVVAWRMRTPAWVAVWLGAVGVELICRHVLTRPALYRGGIHVSSFDVSWPSGHVLRSALVAAVLAAAWPRLRWWLAAWLVAVAVLLELAGAHTPTDVAGGLLLALLALLAAGAARAALRER